ncbi:MAG: hypothetical protein EOP89_04385 [Lysobacteraceae bacterium]|nr:MAG: hypothetical protein EOP89_04385 [Xanthomonadaceae bacterium]
MKRAYLLGALSLAALSLAACAHPEDRRWAALVPASTTDAEPPTVAVYSFATPQEGRSVMRLRDLTGEGQAAYIAQMSGAGDAATLRKRLAAPIDGEHGVGPTIRPGLDRTLVVSVQKPASAGVGDRLMRTVVTITPVDRSFEFAGYTIAATDNKVQDIAKLSTTSDASLDVSLAPPIKALGDVGISGKASRSHTTSADIVQQYEKLNIDIDPKTMTIIRESERGLDVVGNTIVNLTIVPRPPENGNILPLVFLAASQDLVQNGVLRTAKAASIDLKPMSPPVKCAVRASVTMRYLMRRVESGAEYYTEGKQTVSLVQGDTKPVGHILVREEETQLPLWGIVTADGQGLIASTGLGASAPLVFDNYSSAQEFAAWLDRTRTATIGKAKVQLRVNGAAIASMPSVMPYELKCASTAL